MAIINKVIVILADKSIYAITDIKSIFADSEGGVQITGNNTKGESDRFQIDSFLQMTLLTNSNPAAVGEIKFNNEAQFKGEAP